MPYIYRDTNGQSWEVIVNTDGSLSTVAVASGSIAPGGNANCTISVQSVVDYARTHAELMPLAGVGGFSNEPALSLANDTLNEILSPPYAWKFNRVVAGLFVTTPAAQDSLFAGATAFALNGRGGASIDLASNNGITVAAGVVTVRTLDRHRLQVGDTVYMTGVTMTTGTSANYNSTETNDGTSTTWTGGWGITSVGADGKSFTFAALAGQNNADVGGAAGITDFKWLEYATMVDENETSAPRRVRYAQASRTLQPTGTVNVPNRISAHTTANTGIISLRFSSVPGSTTWGVTLVYQAKPPLITDLTVSWSPVPDELAYVYRQVFLAKAFKFVGASRWPDEYKQAEADIAKALGEDDSEASEEFIVPADSLLGDGVYY